MTVAEHTVNMADTSRYSYYVDDDFYARLIAGLNDWEAEGIAADEAVRSEVERLLYREARLLDQAKLEEWLRLFTHDCLYWIPSVPGGGNPREEVSIAFDDRRRLEDRIYRIRTGFAWSQVPLSRTVRLLGNIEVWKDGGEDKVRARANVLISEFRAGRYKQLAGWYGFRLRKEDGQWKIAVKQIHLLDCDQGHENLTLLL
jgi:benzoate/toluate 1,2-dioxygenase beta subunit